MLLFQRWWWPVFVVIYPLSAFLIPGVTNGVFQTKFIIATFWLLIGLVFEVHRQAGLRFSDIAQLPKALRFHLPVTVALCYGIWTLVCSATSSFPGISFLGSLGDSSDGGLWNFGLSLIFILVYIQVKQDQGLSNRLIYALLVLGSILFTLAMYEFFAKRGIFYPDVQVAVLPLVSFFGKGHLMGVMALICGVALALWFQGKKWTILPFGAFLTLISLSFHRAPWLAVLATIPIAYWKTRKLVLTVTVVAVAATAIILGTEIGKAGNTGIARDLSSGTTLSTRSLLWKAAAGGILARPITGWGGGNFQFHFFNYLTQKELEDAFRLEMGVTFRSIIGADNINPMFAITTLEGAKTAIFIPIWKAHNQILDVGLMWGIPGIIFYVILVYFGIRNAIQLDPLSIGMLVYQIFLITWFIPPDAEGAIFAIWGAACAINLKDR
jgi:hypothetical protein